MSGLTEAFVIDDSTREKLIDANPRSKSLIKPFIVGKDIRRWSIDGRRRWLLYIPHGADLREFGEVIRHLRKFKQQLEGRATSQEWYELQQPQQRFISIFQNPKIVFPDIAKEPRFTLDVNGNFMGNTVYAVASDDMYLLGVLNSSPVDVLYRSMSAQIRGGYLRFFTQYVEQIPIPNASSVDRQSIGDLSERCLKRKGGECRDIESEINERVARLYGLPVPTT